MMKVKKLFRLTFTDESRLEQRGSWVMSPLKLWCVATAVALAFMSMGALLLWISPLRSLMPGYLTRESRLAAETAVMRIDSLRGVLEADREYIAGVMRALHPESTPRGATTGADRDSLASKILPLAADSLPGASEREKRFSLAVQRREGFNLQVLAPLAAEGVDFCFPATSGTYGAARDQQTQTVILPRTAAVVAVADGSVVGVTRSVREHGYIIWIQHDNGFLSRYSRLGIPMVDQGSRVERGEAIALPASGNATDGARVEVKLWHDGEPLRPLKYLPMP